MSLRLLLDLHEETWGQRLRRAREASGLTLEEAAKRVSRVIRCSAPTLHRLERLEERPTEWRRMVLAWLTVVAYGYKPSSFDLPDNPFPVPMRDFDTIPEILGGEEGSAVVSAVAPQPSESPDRLARQSRSRSFGWPACAAGQSGLSRAA